MGTIQFGVRVPNSGPLSSLESVENVVRAGQAGAYCLTSSARQV